MKAKSKTGMRWGTLRFVGIWTLGYMVAWLVWMIVGGSFLTIEVFLIEIIFNTEYVSKYLILPYILWSLVALGSISLLQALVQTWVVQRGLVVNMQGWLRTTFIGGLTSVIIMIGFFYHILMNYFSLDGWHSLFLFAIWLTPTLLGQIKWLRQRVNNAWLWSIVPIVNIILFMIASQWNLDYGSGFEYEHIVVISLMMGIVSGTVMRYLWTQTPDIATEKAKSDQSVSTSERLQLPDDASDEDDAWQLAQRDNRLKGSS